MALLPVSLKQPSPFARQKMRANHAQNVLSICENHDPVLTKQKLGIQRDTGALT